MKEQTPIKVLIADPNESWFNALSLHLKNVPDIKILGYAENQEKLLKKIKKNKPDVLLLDIDFVYDKFKELIKELSQKHPKTKILVSSFYGGNHEFLFEDCLKNGATGYYGKEFIELDVLTCLIKQVAIGRTIILFEGSGTPKKPLKAKKKKLKKK